MAHRSIITILLVLIFGGLPTIGFSAILTFDGNICSSAACTNNATIDQTYGDIAGQLDVVWDNDLSTVGANNFWFWDLNYSDLTNVAYGANGQTVEIFLDPAPGFEVTLLGFDLGGWNVTDRDTQVTVLTGAGTTEFSSGSITVLGTTASVFSFALTSIDGFRIQFGPDAFNVGIDNIEYTVAAVIPLPAGVWLFGTALLGLIGFGKLKTNAAVKRKINWPTGAR